ncbi:MAG: murI [Chloroflexi bacterium]|nr:murI [Chloroflexota bacterium]
MEQSALQAPIGIFDSGIGGLSVLRAILREPINRPIIYLADQAHVPYGQRSLADVRQFSQDISSYLIDQGCKIIVVACNTASAAALYSLRMSFPEVPFVGMEPAVKPAAEQTRSGVVGVLATPATFQGVLYASVVERFAGNVQLLQATCPGLVEQIEAGRLDSPETREILSTALGPMLDQGIDTIVLGCTHYPFVIPLIQEIAGPTMRVIDPAPAIARQVRRVLVKNQSAGYQHELPPSSVPLRMITTGSPSKMADLLPRLLGRSIAVERLTLNVLR